MKGVVFNLLEQAVTDAHGDDVWIDLLEEAGVDGAYTSLGSYPDSEIVALVGAAANQLDLGAADVLRWFGRAAMPMLAERYQPFFAGHVSARSFILSVNDIIHPEVRKLYSGAGCPHFHFGDDSEGRLVIGYQSPRRMCHLAHGFVEGAADRFGEQVSVEHMACMLEGSPVCRLAVRWLH
ncbi:MAG: heme NO-binding protein [Alphaproteobacteria bacterium]|nr:MAG: heme NO-binding protein [Alphaproteobacteria bacterium]